MKCLIYWTKHKLNALLICTPTFSHTEYFFIVNCDVFLFSLSEEKGRLLRPKVMDPHRGDYINAVFLDVSCRITT